MLLLVIHPIPLSLHGSCQCEAYFLLLACQQSCSVTGSGMRVSSNQNAAVILFYALSLQVSLGPAPAAQPAWPQCPHSAAPARADTRRDTDGPVLPKAALITATWIVRCRKRELRAGIRVKVLESPTSESNIKCWVTLPSLLACLSASSGVCMHAE